MKLSVCDDELFLEHLAPAGHPEREARLGAARAAVADCGVSVRLPPRDAKTSELLRVHSPAHVERILAIAGRSGFLDDDTFYSPGSSAAALRASGGGLALVESLLTQASDFGLCISRPPGHHATSGQAMGFCLVNHIAVAAAHARGLGCERVMILDFDVHHGNGTEEIFYADDHVLYASVHQSPQYPGTGLVTDLGVDEGRGYTLNVPLPAGAGDAAYVECFSRIFCPAIRKFDPDMLLVSAGYDAHERDPLGGMCVSDAGFGEVTRLMLDAMPRGSRGRTLFLLEGGYDLDGIRGGLRATLKAALDASGDGRSAAPAPSEVTAADRQQLETAVKVHGRRWGLV